jgi:sarcosine oxidase subunit alpha
MLFWGKMLTANDMRIKYHPILKFKKDKKVSFLYNGRRIEAYAGESIASALNAAGIRVLTHSIKYNRPRGFFCGIGKCSSCLMTVDGIPNVKTCIVPVKEGMIVESQDGKGNVPKSMKMEREEVAIDTDIVVIGAGPAGLSSTIHASRMGAEVTMIDENTEVGGQLIKQTHMFFGSKKQYAGVRGINIARKLFDELKDATANLLLQASVIGYYENGKHEGKHMLAAVQGNKLIRIYAKKIIVATGASENLLIFPGNDLPGVCGAGGVQTLMNVYGVKPGKNVLMVGAGNVGLIVSYQLLQAGMNVKMVIEALPTIGGYFVHAAKLRRFGVPILTSHTIKKAIGKERVESAAIVKLDKNWKEIKNSEFNVDIDLICLAVGLTPSSEILFQAGCEMMYVPELGGHIALHNKNLETSVDGIYVAGDASGIEEASTAMMEGKVAGMDAAMKIGKKKKIEQLDDAKEQLKILRKGPFGEKGKVGKEKVLERWRRAHEL